MIMRLMPAMFVFFAFISPSALVVYFITSNLYRIGMQAYITRTLYHGEDSLGAQAQKATLEAKKLKEEGGGPDLLPRLGKRAKAGGTPSGRRGTLETPAAGATAATTAARPARRPAAADVAHDERPEPVQEEEEAPLVEWVETTGKTVEEAKDAALDQLGVDEQDAEFEVVEEPKTGPVRPDCGARRGCGPGCGRRSPARRSSGGIAAGRPGPDRAGRRRAETVAAARAAAAEAGGSRTGARRRAEPRRRARRRTGPRAQRRRARDRNRKASRGSGRSGPKRTADHEDDEQGSNDMSETELASRVRWCGGSSSTSSTPSGSTATVDGDPRRGGRRRAGRRREATSAC